MNRVIWCTPGNPRETDLIAAVTSRGFTIVRRCVEAVDVLAAASIESGAAVVIDIATPRLSGDTVAAIPGSTQRTVIALASDSEAAMRARSWGIHAVVMLDESDAVERVVTELGTDRTVFTEPVRDTHQPSSEVRNASCVTAVYGPAGAPGRSTIALGIAEAWSRSGERVCLIDADTIGPSLALLVGMTEDVSGVLVAARYADQGALDIRSLGSACRRLDDRLWLMSGVGSPDRWSQLRPASFERVARMCAQSFDRVVIDTNSLLNVDAFDDAFAAGMPARDAITRAALQISDSVLVVTQPDAVSLVRLVSDLPTVMNVTTHSQVSVAVNRSSRREAQTRTHVRDVLVEAGMNVPVHSLPDDASVTTCRKAGSLLWEVASSKKLRRSLTRLGHSLAA